MSPAIVNLLVWMAVIDLPSGTELQYSGTLVQQTRTDASDVKSFNVQALIVTGEDGIRSLAYVVDERGGGNWGWPERFGWIPLDQNASPKVNPIRILYTRDGQHYPMNLRSPCFEFREKLATQFSWTDGRLEYTVTRAKKMKDRSCFQVDVASNLGRIQSLTVEAETGTLVSYEGKVIIGRGEEFQIKMELQSQGQLPAADLEKNQTAFSSLIALQTALRRTGEQTQVELTPEQLELVRKTAPQLEKEATGTIWSRLVESITRDSLQQQKRLDGVAGMRQKLVGQAAPEWKLKLTDGNTITSSDMTGKVVVLHFWQYRGEPLTEPYGQIGYLDFLNSKRKKLGVQVIGVNVDERFVDPRQSNAATRSMKSLLEFMKISYDMATDDGSVLAEFGDPRSAGAPLPLWIVIGHDGQVTHHHSGYYQIKPDEGLKPLDDAVVEALRRQKGVRK